MEANADMQVALDTLYAEWTTYDPEVARTLTVAAPPEAAPCAECGECHGTDRPCYADGAFTGAVRW